MKKDFMKRPSAARSNEAMAMKEVLDNYFQSDSPLAEAYRKRQARQTAKQRTTAGPEVYHPNTHLDIDVKTLLRHDYVMRPGISYPGTLRRDVNHDEFRYDEHFTFTEGTPVVSKRNPRVFEGKYVTVTQREDGSFRPNLKQVVITDSFDIIGYASAVSNELLWALESLVRER